MKRNGETNNKRNTRMHILILMIVGLWVTIALIPVGWKEHRVEAQAPPIACSITQVTNSVNTGHNFPTMNSSGDLISLNSTGDYAGNNPGLDWEVFLYTVTTNTYAQVTDSAEDGGPISLQDVPVIAADGARIIVESDRDILGTNSEHEREIFIYDVATDSFVGQAGNMPGTAFGLLTPSLNGNGTRIAFHTFLNLTGGNPDFFNEVYLYNTGSQVMSQVTSSPTHSERPSISADGNRIAFVSDANLAGANADGNREVFLRDIAAGTFTQITNSTGGGQSASREAVISPDGSRLVFISSRDLLGTNPDGFAEVFLYDIASSSLQQVTSTPTDTFDTGRPTINANGTRVAFMSTSDFTGGNADGNPEIFLFDTIQAAFTQVTNSTGTGVADNSQPSLNWTGDRLAFLSMTNLTGGNPDLNTEFYIAQCGAATPTPTPTATPTATPTGTPTATPTATPTPTPTATPTATPTPTPTPITIVFSSFDVGNLRIFKMNSDGTAVTRLTSGTSPDYEPAISPDGSRIIFSRGVFSDIYAVGPNGGLVTRLTTDSSINMSPAWSPDGTRIVFWSMRFASVASLNNAEIMVMNANGTGVTRLTTNPSQDSYPAWSPDGTKIAFASNRFGQFEILVMNSDGSGVTRLTSNLATDLNPTWSPDGTKIAFVTNRYGNWEIAVMNAVDGSGVTRLTNHPAADVEPAWGADGRIVFVSRRTGGSPQIHIIGSDGSGVSPLTNRCCANNTPNW